MKPLRLVVKWGATMISAALVGRAQIPAPTDAPKPRTPEESAAAFQLPDGFEMRVVASEPLIAAPSSVCWDEYGRMYVSELHGYNLAGQLDIEELNKTGKLDTQVRRVGADEKFRLAARRGTYGIIKRLEDTDGDGRMDKATVWATNLPPAYGMVPARGGLIVACAPDILFFSDRDGDGKAEVREVLFTGFQTGELERGINAPQWGPDGWIYFGRGWHGREVTGPKLAHPVQIPDTDFRIRPDGSAIEPITGGTHTFGFALLETGDRFTVTTTSPGIYIAPLPWRYLARNPDAATPGLEVNTGDHHAYQIAPTHPWRRKRAEDPEYFKYYHDRYGAAESEASGWFTSACGPMVYRDNALPGLQGQYLVCEPAGNLIHRARIEPHGTVMELHRFPGEETREFAASTDPWTHPIRLQHGPDGALWVIDYYREIIEDYSAIPRHLQQQYQLSHGYDYGRIYRLVHREMKPGPSARMNELDTAEWVRELSSPLFWRRETALRLLAEHGDVRAEAPLRESLSNSRTTPSGLIGALHGLDQLGKLKPADVVPLVRHPESVVRIHALQLGDRWFTTPEGGPLLEASLAAASAEKDPRVLIQFALSLGESRDPRAFAQLARMAREHLELRWMDTALLSSLHERSLEMISELSGNAMGSVPLLHSLAKSVAARRNEIELVKTLGLVEGATSNVQAAVLNGLAEGRKNVPHHPLSNGAARKQLAALAAGDSPEIRQAAQSLQSTFEADVSENDEVAATGGMPPEIEVSDATFRKFVDALAGPRDLNHGHELFQKACAPCHRIGAEGSEFGPDMLGELGVAEETLIRHIILPNERIRPGYETTLVETQGGKAVLGILKSDGATSLTVALPNGVQQVLLRKDVTGVRRLPGSIMPSFAEAFTPADLACLLAWLRSNLGAPVKSAANPNK